MEEFLEVLASEWGTVFHAEESFCLSWSNIHVTSEQILDALWQLIPVGETMLKSAASLICFAGAKDTGDARGGYVDGVSKQIVFVPDFLCTGVFSQAESEGPRHRKRRFCQDVVVPYQDLISSRYECVE